jgi:DNA helicase HerA-like ATPase
MIIIGGVMDEKTYEKLGSGLGLSLSNWESKMSVSGLIKGNMHVAPEKSGFAHLGNIEGKELPPESLDLLVQSRNENLVYLLKEYEQIMGKFRWEDDEHLAQFSNRLKVVPFEADTVTMRGKPSDFPSDKLRSLEVSWGAYMGAKYGLSDLGKDNLVFGQFSNNSSAFSFLIPDFKSYRSIYGSATSRHSQKSPQTAGSISDWKDFVLGLGEAFNHFFFRSITAYIPFEAFKRHAYIVGGSGSGKSELIKLLVHSIIHTKSAQKFGSIVLDPHGDLVTEIARFKECENNERVIFFDPSKSQYEMPCIDIFYLPDEEEKTVDIIAGNIADAFEEIISDASISAQMRTLLIPCVSVLLRRGNSTISDLQRFMIEDENRDLIELGRNSPNAGHAQFFRTKFETKTYEATKSSIYTRLQQLLNSTQFRRLVNPKATINLEDELNNGKIVLVNLSKSEIGEDVSSAFGRLIISQIKNIGFRRQQQPKAKRTPTFVFVDECQNYIGESIEVTLTELRKFGIHMILANQVLGQGMSTQLEKIILANTAVKFSGSNAEHTLQKMAKEMRADVEELRGLTVGRFCAKVNIPQKATFPFVFKAPSHLVGNSHGMDAETWLSQKKRGWRGYVHNKELDAVYQAKPESVLSESFDTQTPDYVEDDTTNHLGGPKFKL